MQQADEVIVKQPDKEDYMTDSTEVIRTGRVVAEVVGISSDHIPVLVKVEDWFVKSDVLKMGTGRVLAT